VGWTVLIMAVLIERLPLNSQGPCTSGCRMV
jgi:hypothetical protein